MTTALHPWPGPRGAPPPPEHRRDVLLGILRCGHLAGKVPADHDVAACAKRVNEELDAYFKRTLAAWAPCRTCPVPKKCGRQRACAFP